jgi:hypothetical protein
MLTTTSPVLALISVLFAAPLAPLLLILWSRRGWSHHSPWPALAVAASYGTLHLATIHENVIAPRVWDFGCFWLYGHVAAAGLNIYDPSKYAVFAAPFHPDRGFVQEVVNVGFPYPPPTIFLFWPLGQFADIHGVAQSLWYAVQFLALAAAALVLQRAMFREDGPAAAIVILALTLLLPAFAVDTHFAQTSSVCLFFVALAFAGRYSPWGTIWSVLAAWVKPYAFALLVADLARRRGGRLAVAFATVLLSLIAALVALGPNTMLTYFVAGPVGREPAYVYGGTASILGLLVRASNDGHLAVAAVRPLYASLAVIIASITAYLCARAPKGDPFSFCLALLLGLLLYPATQEAYGVVHLIPLLLIWKSRERLPLGTVGSSIIIAVTILLQRHIEYGFPPNAFLWICCATAMIAARNIGFDFARNPPLGNQMART